MIARMVFSVFYGIEIKPHDDPYVVLSEKPMLESARAITTSHGLVVRASIHCFLRTDAQRSCSIVC
jgi:hypothetical protein